MADDRLVIACTRCKEARTLMVYSFGQYFYTRERDDFTHVQELTSWLNQHVQNCTGGIGFTADLFKLTNEADVLWNSTGPHRLREG